jgi:3-hydroxyisobutyrate dehydrogenase-like beta-hydroxyacid dehydrogenase
MGESVGIIGLGLVGRAIAARLAAADFAPVGYDADPQALARFGFARAESAAGVAARCARIVLAVYDTPDVEQVAAEARPKLFIDCTTGGPLRIEALASRLAATAVGYVEAPLSGSSAAIARGEATMFVGGDASGCEDILAAIASRRHYAGAVGMGARAKLATNLVLGLNRAALAEGMAFAEQLGIGRAAFLAMVEDSPAASSAAVAKGRKMLSADWAPESRIRQHLKDVSHMLALAGELKFNLPLTEVHSKLLASAVAAGDGELDNAAIIRRWEKA